MPNGDLFKLPAFPTSFTEEDAKRLEQLEKQREIMEEAYKVKFSREAWGRAPGWEKAARQITPSWFTPAIRALPGVAETWEFGYTPEQFQKSMFEVEEEYKELARKQKITGLLPNIQTGIVIAALQGEPITDTSDLLSTFPELRADFTEEEINYLARLSQALSRATPEQIMSGELFASEPGQLPITGEDVDFFFPKGVQDPRFILSTVAFSKDLEAISSALREAYPPAVTKEEASEELRARIQEYFRQLGIEQGLVPEGQGKAAIKAGHEEIAQSVGENIIFKDESGRLLATRRRSDGSVWSAFRADLLGYYDEKLGMLTPFSPIGEPLPSGESRESLIKDLWDAFYLDLKGTGFRIKQAFLYTYPASILDYLKRQLNPEGYELTPAKFFTEFSPYWAGIAKLLDKRTKEALIESMDVQLEDMKQDYNRRVENYYVWVAERPELQPRPEWVIDVEGLGCVDTFKKYGEKILTNPSFLGYVMADNSATILAFATTLAVAYGTRNPYLTMAVASALFAPIETQDLYEDLIASGASEQFALEISPKAGALIASIESLGALPIARVISPAFFAAFRKNIARQIVKMTTAEMAKRAAIQVGYIEAAEVTEEILQEIIHNAYVQTVDENRALLENVPEVTIRAAISMLPLSAFGGGAHFQAMRHNLPPKVREGLDADTEKAKAAGAAEEDAQAGALVKLMETETGQAQVKEASEKAEEKLPDTSNKIAKMEERLISYNEEIKVTESSLEIQRDRLEKMKVTHELASERLAQHGLIEGLEERLTELEKDKKLLQKKIQKARDKLRIEPIIPKTPTEEVVQQEAVDSTTVPYQFISPWLQADPLLPIRRPRVLDWEDEQAGVDKVLQDSRIAKAVKLPPEIKATRELVENTINRLQDEYDNAKESNDKEAIKDVEDRLRDIAKDAGLRAKALLGKRWGDIPPDGRLKLVSSALPDKSLKFSGLKEGTDMEYFMQFLEEMTGAPFYSILVRIEDANATAETAKELILQRISTDPHFKDVRTNEEALDRVTQEVNARNEIQGVEHPDNISENEMLLADAIQDIYDFYKPIVRYLRVARTRSTMEAFKEEFPDAVEKGKELELEMAIKLKEKGNLDDLWAYLFTLEWGVIEHGFDPRMIASPGLRVGRRGGLRVTRGKGRLMRREKIEFPAGKMSKNILARLASYVEQMEIQWRIEPEIDTLGEWWDIVGDKFEHWGQIEKGLETWLERVQGISLGYNWFDRQVRRLWRQAMAAVFLEPFMAFRNLHQAMLFHPDRMELARVMFEWKSLPADVREQFHIGFDTYISQLGGLRRDWLHVGERGFLVPEWFNRMADTICLYGMSDYYPRQWSAMAAFNKAYRATQQYRKDGNIGKWIKDSGAIHLRQTERNYALTHYLGQVDETFDKGIAGFREIDSNFMTSFYIAKRIADITHFKYRRSSRGLIEMGKTGSTLWNLVVFLRGYAQRLYFQAEKIKRAFRGEATWAEARSGYFDIMKLVMVSMLISQMFATLTGRRRNPYDPLNILFGWQFGGLFVGIAQDVSILIGDLATIINPNATEEDKQFALNRIPRAVSRIPETLIPFLRRGIDIAETLLSKKNIVAYGVRQLIAMLDEKYTPEELEEIERNLWEQIRKAVLGGEVQDPAKLQVAMENIEVAETKLGTMDVMGRFYTLGDFGNEIASLTRDIPTVLVTEQEGYTPRVLFYKDCEAQWAELFTLPSNERDDWRKDHVLEEAMLLFWERYKRPVFTAGIPEAEEVKSLLLMWFDRYEIDKSMHGWWATWELPGEIPPPEE